MSIFCASLPSFNCLFRYWPACESRVTSANVHKRLLTGDFFFLHFMINFFLFEQKIAFFFAKFALGVATESDTRGSFLIFYQQLLLLLRCLSFSIFLTTISYPLFVHLGSIHGGRVCLSWLRVSVCSFACFIHSTICSVFDRLGRLHKYKREPSAMVSTEFSFHVTSSPPWIFCYAKSSPAI